MAEASTAPLTGVIDDARARRNALILSGAQVLYGCNATILIISGGLVGQMLAADPALATLPITTFVLGTAMWTVPASMFMRRFGRRAGFMTGAGFGLVGALLAMTAIIYGSFWLFVLATGLSGVYQAFAMYYRFAAADVASSDFKAKAISWVLVGGVAAAILGPQLVIWFRDAFAPFLFVGAPAPPDHEPVEVHHCRSLRDGQLRHHEPGDDRDAPGHDRVQPHGRRRGVCHPMARGRDVRSEFRHL